jgi:hypothetical protein
MQHGWWRKTDRDGFAWIRASEGWETTRAATSSTESAPSRARDVEKWRWNAWVVATMSAAIAARLEQRRQARQWNTWVASLRT